VGRAKSDRVTRRQFPAALVNTWKVRDFANRFPAQVFEGFCIAKTCREAEITNAGLEADSETHD
jgi:hypothetical protein